MSGLVEFAQKDKKLQCVTGKLTSIPSGTITSGKFYTYEYIEIDGQRYGNMNVVGI